MKSRSINRFLCWEIANAQICFAGCCPDGAWWFYCPSSELSKNDGTIVNSILDVYGDPHSYSGPNLEPNAYLDCVDLSYAYLPGVDLRHTILESTNLSDATMEDSHLSNVNLSGAILEYAYFSIGNILKNGQTVLHHGFDADGLRTYLEASPIFAYACDLKLVPEPSTVLLLGFGGVLLAYVTASLCLQNTAELLNPDSLTHPGTKTEGGQFHRGSFYETFQEYVSTINMESEFDHESQTICGGCVDLAVVWLRTAPTEVCKHKTTKPEQQRRTRLGNRPTGAARSCGADGVSAFG